MMRFRILLLALALICATGCSSLRGEQIETGFGQSDVEAVDQVSVAGLPQPPGAARLAGELTPASIPDNDLTAPIGLGQGDATASFDFQARELYSGSMVEGAELFGQGKVLVTFVQPGCDITVDGGSVIAKIAQDHPEAIFVIVHSGADDEAYRAFAEEAMLFQENMVHLSDTYGSLAKRYGIGAYPTTLLIDGDMRVTAVTGAMDEDSHQQAVEAVTTRFIAE